MSSKQTTCFQGHLLNWMFIVFCVLCSIGLSLSPFYALRTAADKFESRDISYLRRSISWSLSFTPDELAVDMLMNCMNLLVVPVAVSRQIQIRVVFSRVNEYKGAIPFLNVMNAIVLILASIGYIMTVEFDTTDAAAVHKVSATVAWTLSLIYSGVHIYLTVMERRKCYNHIKMDLQAQDSQRKLDKYQKLACRFMLFNFELVYLICAWIVLIVFSTIFLCYQMFGQFPGGNHLDHFGPKRKYFYEWWGWWLMNSFYLVIAIELYRDPVDDELKEYLVHLGTICCNPCQLFGRKRRKSNMDVKMTHMVSGSAAIEIVGDE